MVGIVAYGAYVPRLRLNRQAVYDANKWFAAGLRGLAKGERSMANWDEDSITMAVEASRDCLTSHKAEDVRSLYFASTTHPFKDRQNAGVIGTALSIEQNLSASDVGGSLKAGTSALIAGLNASKNGGGPAPGRRRRQAHGARRLVQRAELRRRRRGAAVRHRERDRQAGRPSLGVDGFRRPFPRRRDRLRLRLGRALDPRRGLLEDRAARRSRRRSPPASSRAATSPSSSCRA